MPGIAPLIPDHLQAASALPVVSVRARPLRPALHAVRYLSDLDQDPRDLLLKLTCLRVLADFTIASKRCRLGIAQVAPLGDDWLDWVLFLDEESSPPPARNESVAVSAAALGTLGRFSRRGRLRGLL